MYGPHEDTQTEAVRKRRYPVIGDGGGIMSYIHLDDAAAATVLALEHDGPAIYNITDDEPAPMREWLPALVFAADWARVVGGAGSLADARFHACM